AVGVSAAFTDVRDRTQAFIGDLEEPEDPLGYGGNLGSVTADNNVSLTARSTPHVWSVAASAGGAARGGARADKGRGATASAGGSGANINAPTGLGETGNATAGSSGGLGISGSVAFNWVEEDTRAFIRDLVTVRAGNQVHVEAFSNPVLVAIAGGFVFTDGKGIGGTFGFNHRDQTPTAYVAHATITGLVGGLTNPDLQLFAHSDNTIVFVTASAAITGSGGTKSSFDVAGEFNLGDISNNTSAYVGDG